MNLGLSEFEIFDDPELLLSLRKDGCIILPGFLNKEERIKIIDDLKKIRSNPPPNIYGKSHVPIPIMYMIRHRRFDEIRSIAQLSKTPGFLKLPEKFFNEPSILGDILSLESNPHPEAILDWHVDSKNRGLTEPNYRRLKYHIYLNDVSTENGAFGYVPGTSPLVTYLRQQIFQANIPEEMVFTSRDAVQIIKKHIDLIPDHLKDVARLVCEELFDHKQAIDKYDICGPAGTVIIFDDSGIHRGGIVHSGSRSILRYGWVPKRFYNEDNPTKIKLARSVLSTVIPSPYRYIL